MTPLYEWQVDPRPYGKEQLERLCAYLDDVWMSRRQYLDIGEDEPVSNSQRFVDLLFDGTIKARNYVGVLQFEGKRLEIAPKILQDRNTGISWKQHLLFWLGYCHRIRFPFSIAELAAIDFDDLLELLIYIFAHFSAEVLGRQPFHSYTNVVEEIVYLKGRLAFDDYIRNNLATGRWQHFTCEHQPLIYDNGFNRIIKYVTRRLMMVTENTVNQEKLGEILHLLDEVTDVECSASDCDRVKLNALFDEHQKILDLCKLYLSSQMIDTTAADSHNFCFLVPMEYVFEDFLLTFLTTHFPQYHVRQQHEAWLAMAGDRRVFKMVNDAYIPGRVILDAKYKIRSKADGLKGGVSQVDMYQMLAYSVIRNCDQVLLLYPYHPVADVNNATVTFSIQAPMLNKPVRITAVNVDICFARLADAQAIMKERLGQVMTGAGEQESSCPGGSFIAGSPPG